MSAAKLTPILIVTAIEECLSFWEQTMGYEVAAQVPHGDHLGFVILRNGNAELMLQSESSLGSDLPTLRSEQINGCTFLYADVPSLDQALGQLRGATIVVPRRKTDYGAEEVWVKTASNHVIGLSELAK